jgi:hypothetical protein
MTLSRKETKFKIDAFADTTNILLDKLGKNRVSTFIRKDTLFVALTNIDYCGFLMLAGYEIGKFPTHRAPEIKVHEYDSGLFLDPIDNTELHLFNLRDVVSYVSYPNFTKDKTPEYNLIATCYNNGILFFQGINLDDFGKDEIGQIHLNLTYVYRVINTGRIFTERSFKLEDKITFNFFTSTHSPPVVYEFQIDRNTNVNIKRVYKHLDPGAQEVVGQDMISTNEKFLAFLVYDYKVL